MSADGLRTAVKSLRDFWLDVANWHDLHGETDTITYRQAVARLDAILNAPAGGPAPDAVGGAVEPREVVVTAPPAGPAAAVLVHVETWPHRCQHALIDLGPVPAPGSVARCSCSRYYVVDDRGERWTRVRWWNTKALAVIADYEETHRTHGGAR